MSARRGLTSALLLAVVPLLPPALGAEASFEVRYAAVPVAVPEPAGEGARPRFRVEVRDGVVRIEDDEAGAAVGEVLVGRRLPRLDARPTRFCVRLEYRTACEVERRTGHLRVYLLTPAAWARYDENPATRRPPPDLSPSELLFSAEVQSMHGPDVTEWTAWTSPNLALAAEHQATEELVLAVGFTGHYRRARETASIRALEVEAGSEPPPTLTRERKYPPKTRRTLHSMEDLARARENLAAHPAARRVLAGIVARADRWAARSDEQLEAAVPPASAPRAFNVSTKGCPVHGKAIYAHGTYPWIVSEGDPGRIECPVGHEVYPDREHPDDGWGWTAPDGERYWLAAYACHWHWARHTLPGVLALARAYLLTGEAKYGHAGALLLARIAEQYPTFDYATQSRFGLTKGGRYPGKILNHIWETGTLADLAEAYDHLFDHFDRDGVLQKRLGRSGAGIRSLVEAHVLEEGIERVLDGTISGNFGMHQRALAVAAVVREKGPVDEWIGYLLRNTDGRRSHLGLAYGLYDLVYRDGMPEESAPGYCLIWPRTIAGLAPVLARRGVDLFDDPRVLRMLLAPLDLVAAGGFTPDVGDSGSVWGGLVSTDPEMFRIGWLATSNERLRRHLTKLGAVGEGSFRTFESLFGPPVPPAEEDAEAPGPEPASRLLDGYGMAILEAEAAPLAASLYYGRRGGHGHFDPLVFDLYANNQKMMPDLGYPDFMNDRVPGIYSWSKHPVSHNGVVVDGHAGRATVGANGAVRLFGSAGGVHVVRAIGGGERTLVLVETGRGRGYLLDVIRTVGGEEQVYSLHGPPGRAELAEGAWSEPAPGTLAGPEVPVGALYDDPVRGRPGYRGSFAGYRGSGTSHFEAPQTLRTGRPVVHYAHAKDPSARLRLEVLTTPGDEVITALARVSPVKHPEKIRYVLTRRRGERPLDATFVGVFEPYRGEPEILSAEREDRDDGVLVTVRRRGATDRILCRRGEEAEVSVVTTEPRADGSDPMLREARFRARGAYGTVESVDPRSRRATIRFPEGDVTPAEIEGRHLLVRRGSRNAWHRVTEARSGEDGIVCTFADELFVGRIPAAGVEGKTVRVPFELPFGREIHGAAATDEGFRSWARVAGMRARGLALAEEIPARRLTDANGDGATDLWIVSFGPGWRVTLPAVEGGWR